MESINNKTFTPLQAGRAFIGTYDKVDAYSSCVLSIKSDQPCLITMYQSQNRTLEYPVSVAYTTNPNQYSEVLPLYMPYVYFVVRNEGNDTQTFLNFTIIYKTAYPTSGGGSGGNVNIFDSTGALITSDGTNLNVKLNDVNPTLIQDDGLKTYIVNSSLPITLSTQRTSGKLWDNQSIATGATSDKLDAHTVSSTNLSVYGTTSIAGKLSVLFSADNSAFYESQYNIDATSGAFGFSCPCSAPYVRLLWSGSSTTITAIISAS